MKYKTFRALLIGTGAAAVIGGTALLGRSCFSSDKSKAPQPVTATERKKPTAVAQGPVRAPQGEPIPSAEPVAPQGEPTPQGIAMERPPVEQLRPFDRELLDSVHRNFPGDKMKDAMPGRPFKVNLYKDQGEEGVNRLKIDLDRDDKWDEKWSFSTKHGQPVVKRQVAPNDDENYTMEYRLQGDTWVLRGPPPSAQAAPAE